MNRGEGKPCPVRCPRRAEPRLRTIAPSPVPRRNRLGASVILALIGTVAQVACVNQRYVGLYPTYGRNQRTTGGTQSMKTQKLTLLAALAVVAMFNSARAGVETDPVDMTGVWEGTIACKGLDQVGEKTVSSSRGTMYVTNSGNDAGLFFEASGESTAGPRGGISAQLCGYTIQQSGKTGKGQGVFHETGDGGLNDQTLRFQTIKVFDEKPNGLSGIARGTSIWSPDGSGDLATCSWSFKRTSLTDAVVVFSGC